MTWKEFKEEVERQMEEKDISEDAELWYIDIGHTYYDGIMVFEDENYGMGIK